jgi:uncharacterized protein (TIGR02611 family)
MTVTDGAPGQTESEEARERALKRLHTRLHRNRITGLVTKLVITVVGTLVILVGIVLSGPGVPGPGFVVIVCGLAILSTEFEWAERLLKRARNWLERMRDKARDMDPAVRRRRILLTLLATVVVAGGVAAYLYYYDWPGYAVDGWDWVQDINGAVPELPGM